MKNHSSLKAVSIRAFDIFRANKFWIFSLNLPGVLVSDAEICLGFNLCSLFRLQWEKKCEWANSPLTDSPTYSNDSGSSDRDNRGSGKSPMREFHVPDCGFLQESYTEEELKEESAASSFRDPPPIKNPFILTEASVSSEKSPKKKEKTW